MIIFLGMLPACMTGPSDDTSRILFGVSLLGLAAFTVLTVVKTRHLTDPTRERGTFDVLFLAIGLGMFAICATAVSVNWPEERLDIQSFTEKEAKYNYIGYKRMGELIAKNHPGGRLLLIKHDFTSSFDEPNQIEIAIDKGLKDGLAGKVEIIDVLKVKIGEDFLNGGPSWDGTYTKEEFDNLIDKNQECDAIFSMAGLPKVPKDYEGSAHRISEPPPSSPALYMANFWTDKQVPPMDMFKTGFVKAILTDSAYLDILSPVPENEEEAFDRRFAMLTPENPALRGALNTPVPAEPGPGFVYLVLGLAVRALRSPILVIGIFYIAIAIYALRRVRKNRRGRSLAPPDDHANV